MRKVLSLVILIVLSITLIGCTEKEEQYKITLELNGGSGIESITGVEGSSITVPTITKEGYTLEGWYADETFTTKYEFTSMPGENITLYAKWDMNEYKITLELNGGTGIESITGVEGSSITVPTITKEGYTLEGWYEDETFTTKYEFTSMPGENITLYAKWEISEYTIDVVSNIEGVNLEIVKGSLVDNKQIYTVSTEEVDGYIFIGWRVLGTTTILNTELSYDIALVANTVIEAVYEQESSVDEPTLFYETSFEDGNKGSYSTGDISLNGETWTFNDALVGSLTTDLSVSGKSVRIRDGFIKTNFTISDLAQVIFYAGTYGNDSDGLVQFQISQDGNTWVTVDSFTSTGTLTEYNYVFDEEMFTSLSLDANTSYYLKIVSSDSGRTNIDDFKVYTGEGTVVDNTPLYVLSFTSEMEYSYLIDDVVDLEQCVATHPTLGVTTCEITGSVESSEAGVYEVTYSKTDENGNTAVEVVRITVISEEYQDYLEVDLNAYYDDAEGLFGNDLISALHTIINAGFSGVTYGEVRYILDETDQDPNNSNNLILVYLGTSVDGSWDSGSTWNREHVWPQSLLGVKADNSKINSASDLYNLMPADPGLNSSRGNNPYSEMGLGFEPRDEVKGDVARALFYMMVMYEELDLVNTDPGIHEMAYLDELLAWHFADPVDDFELSRLESIYGEQNNRNPFVDYPHFVNLIWFYNSAQE